VNFGSYLVYSANFEVAENRIVSKLAFAHCIKAIIRIFFAKPPKLQNASPNFSSLPTFYNLYSLKVTMAGRTTINLEPYKAQIIIWFQDENKTSNEIAQLLSETYDKPVAPRTIKRRLKDWNITKCT
jgi:hypothetical protein